MVTQELIAYVKAELNKGKRREDIRASLLSGGGWNEADLNEVFGVVMPLDSGAAAPAQTSVPPVAAKPAPSPTPAFFERDFSSRYAAMHAMPQTPPLEKIQEKVEPKIAATPVHAAPVVKKDPIQWKPMVPAVLFGVLCFAVFYFFRPEIMALPGRISSSFSAIGDKFLGAFNSPEPEKEAEVAPVVVKTPRNCGTTGSPGRNDASNVSADTTFICLGQSASACGNAEGVISDPLFPGLFKVKILDGACTFELSYAKDSTLTDVFGKSMAGRSVTCPISVVKAIDETNPKNPIFVTADTSNPGKYAADVYFYGTLGLFIENNFNQEKITSLGCKGDFINSVIESYKLMQSKV